jgi:hypothetical protein
MAIVVAKKLDRALLSILQETFLQGSHMQYDQSAQDSHRE